MREIKLFGTRQAEPEAVQLAAGRLTAEFFRGALRTICYDGIEVLRGISYLSRDRNWGTYSPEISGLNIDQDSHSFAIAFEAGMSDGKQSMTSVAKIEAHSDGTLRFSVKALARTDFVTNRTGFVVLHPLRGVAGQPVEVSHTDGNRAITRFPDEVSPSQPIFDIQSMTHQVAPGIEARVSMEGNKFEMEDHRNWMDASYKTYSGSLLDPWPYTIEQGHTDVQEITLTISGKSAPAAPRESDMSIPVMVGKAVGTMPDIGTALCLSSPEDALDCIEAIANAGPAYLIGRLDGRVSPLERKATMFREIHARSGIPLTLEVILPAQASARDELACISTVLDSVGLDPNAVIVTQAHDMKSFQPGEPRPPGPNHAEMARAAQEAFPEALIGGGVVAFFTELNRLPVPEGLFDFVTHSVCPTVHATDDKTVMENLESMAWIARSTRQMIGSTPYHLGPSWISTRVNPYGDATFPNPNGERLFLSESDPRQRGLYGAAWMLGLASACAEAGLDSVALASLTGPQGLFCGNLSGLPSIFQETNAEVFPAYHVLAGLAERAAHGRISTECAAASKISILAIETSNGPELWLANLTEETQHVRTFGLTHSSRIHLLDETTFEATLRSGFLSTPGDVFDIAQVLRLRPYAVARITPSTD